MYAELRESAIPWNCPEYGAHVWELSTHVVPRVAPENAAALGDCLYIPETRIHCCSNHILSVNHKTHGKDIIVWSNITYSSTCSVIVLLYFFLFCSVLLKTGKKNATNCLKNHLKAQLLGLDLVRHIVCVCMHDYVRIKLEYDRTWSIASSQKLECSAQQVSKYPQFFRRSVWASSRAVVLAVGSVYRARSRSLPVLMKCWHEGPDCLSAGPAQDWWHGHCGEKLRLLFKVMSDGWWPAVLRLSGLNLLFHEMLNNI